MLAGPDNHVQIASHAAMRPGVAFSSQPDALPIARPRLDAYFERLCAADCALAVAGGTGRDILPRSLATRARHVELHPPAGLGDLSLSIALRTLSRRFDVTLPVAICADILPRNVQPHHAASDRRPERHVYLIFKIGARFGFSLICYSPSSATNSREDVAAPTAPAA